MKKQYLFAAVAVLAFGLAFAACDLLEPMGGEGATVPTTPDTYSDLVIKGTDSNDKTVEITFSRTERAVVPLTTLKTGDKYEIKHDGTVVSKGDITVEGKEITFKPTAAFGGTSFKGTYTNDVKDLRFAGDIPLADSKKITGYKPKPETGGNSSEAQKIADKLGPDAHVNGDNVVVDYDIEVDENLEIPAGVKLIFNTRESNFSIKKNVTVTAKGGIEIGNSRKVSVKAPGDGTGTLVVEGTSGIKGSLVVDATGKLKVEGTVKLEGGTLDVKGDGVLDISGSVIIESGGVLSLFGEKAAAEVYDENHSDEEATSTSKKNAFLTASGSVTVKNGGRFQMPDPPKFLKETKNKITGEIEVEAGGEIILFTGAPPLPEEGEEKSRLHPLIGTASTEADVSVGADYVMDPAANPDSKIKIKVASGKPVLDLTGRAIALGPLNPNDQGFIDGKMMRSCVWITSYTFNVLEDSVLQIGNSTARYSSLIALSGGKLSNKGKIVIFKKSGMFIANEALPTSTITTTNFKVYKQGYESTNPIEPDDATTSDEEGVPEDVKGKTGKMWINDNWNELGLKKDE